uniref:Uncharacterized protein n=1 Tax=Aegilops tauschii subsp. strangulata TaxID=200361 RepID=A0A453NTQ4_AEGTS
NLSVFEAFQDLNDKLNKPFFMDIIILGPSAICISRNNKIFEHINPSLHGWKFIYLEELKLLRYRMKKKYAQQFSAWLESIL